MTRDRRTTKRNGSPKMTNAQLKFLMMNGVEGSFDSKAETDKTAPAKRNKTWRTAILTRFNIALARRRKTVTKRRMKRNTESVMFWSVQRGVQTKQNRIKTRHQRTRSTRWYGGGGGAEQDTGSQLS